MVVDDELGPRESLRMILKPIYEVHAVDNGEDALDYLCRVNVDLVTLDLKMPGPSGIDVLREIKKMRNDVEVVVITGYGTMNTAVDAFRMGAVDFIFKPFNVTEIISIVKKSVERRNFNLAIKSILQRFKAWKFLDVEAQGEALRNLSASVHPSSEEYEIDREIQDSLQQLENFRMQKVSVNYLDFLRFLFTSWRARNPTPMGTPNGSRSIRT